MPHHQHELSSEDVEDLVDPGLAKGGQPPDVRPSDANASGAEGKGLEDIGAPPESAVDENRQLALDPVDDFREALDRASHTLLRSPAVVRHDDPVDAVPYSELRVLTRLDALEHEFELRDVSEPAHDLPREPGGGHGHAGEVEAIEHRLAAEIARPAGLVAARALPRITLAEPHLGFRV